MIGTTISHYKIIEQLGAGGMGVVYKAEDTRLKRTVALKFLPTEFTLDEEAKRRFVHEAQSASALQHNNICTIHDIDESADGQLFIVMDCYEGEPLKEKIAVKINSIQSPEEILTKAYVVLMHSLIANEQPKNQTPNAIEILEKIHSIITQSDFKADI